MAEITIRTKNREALQKIAEFLRAIGFEVIDKEPASKAHVSDTSATEDEFTNWLSLAGIWKDNPVTAEELRLKAWGGRI